MYAPAAGATEHATFRADLPDFHDRVTLFVFVRHRDDLIAVFRVSAQITPQPHSAPDCQTIEHAYLATDWFSVPGRAEGAEVTLFFHKEGGKLQV